MGTKTHPGPSPLTPWPGSWLPACPTSARRRGSADRSSRAPPPVQCSACGALDCGDSPYRTPAWTAARPPGRTRHRSSPSRPGRESRPACSTRDTVQHCSSGVYCTVHCSVHYTPVPEFEEEAAMVGSVHAAAGVVGVVLETGVHHLHTTVTTTRWTPLTAPPGCAGR